MAVITTVTLNHPEIRALLTDRATIIGRRVHRFAQAFAPRESGRLASSIFVVVGQLPHAVYADIGTPLNYGLYQHEGTGIYAGRGMIRARAGRVMRFRPGRSTGPLPRGVEHPERQARPWAYAMAVKGVPPNPYLVQALSAALGPGIRMRRTRGR
jgi:hypothetical protein